VDPLLQEAPYTTKVRCLTGFTACIRCGRYGSGQAVKGDTVATMLSAVGKEISPACNGNPTKVTGSERLVPRIAQTLDAWRKEDQPIMKKLPVEADAPELLVKWGSGTEGSAFKEAVGDLALIDFYYLLCIV